jgi:hypothetical protein
MCFACINSFFTVAAGMTISASLAEGRCCSLPGSRSRTTYLAVSIFVALYVLINERQLQYQSDMNMGRRLLTPVSNAVPSTQSEMVPAQGQLQEKPLEANIPTTVWNAPFDANSEVINEYVWMESLGFFKIVAITSWLLLFTLM